MFANALSTKIRNVTRKVVQSYGPENIKGHLWDQEYARGRWNCLDFTPVDCVYPIIEKYSNNGSILDLGCGSGSTCNKLAATAYLEYTGVDISSVAIEKAKKRTEQNGRAAKNRFFHSEISSYVPTQQFQLILFRDSLYYIALSNINSLLKQYSKYLKPDGVFIVRMGERGKRQKIVDSIVNGFEVIEHYAPEDSTDVVLVFR